MKTNDQATPRPWNCNIGKYLLKISGYPRQVIQISESESDHQIAIVNAGSLEGETNARLIVKAVNCHDKLLSALKAVSKCERGVHLSADVVFNMMEAINEAEQ